MALDLNELIDALKIHSPDGVEIPRNQDDNQPHEPTIARWAADAAQAINAKRGRTTSLETTITTVDGTTDYAMPTGCREITRIRRDHGTTGGPREVAGIPVNAYMSGMVPFGTLPSGQQMSASLDFLNRQQLGAVQREDTFELRGEKVRFLFPIRDGEQIIVRYEVVDRDLESIPEDRFELVLAYLKMKNLKWFIDKQGAAIAVDGDRLAGDSIMVLMRRMRDLDNEWTEGLNAIQAEVE